MTLLQVIIEYSSNSNRNSFVLFSLTEKYNLIDIKHYFDRKLYGKRGENIQI